MEQIRQELVNELLKDLYIKDACKNKGLSVGTYYLWYHNDPEFKAAIDKLEENKTKIVEDSLFKRANGYTYEETKTEIDEDGAVKKTTTIKEIAPDPACMFFWLCNRAKDKWANVNRLEHTGKDGEPLKLNFVNFGGTNDRPNVTP